VLVEEGMKTVLWREIRLVDERGLASSLSFRLDSAIGLENLNKKGNLPPILLLSPVDELQDAREKANTVILPEAQPARIGSSREG
jgi:hypothetical protein